MPQESTNAITPLIVGVDSEVEPPFVDAENMLCGPPRGLAGALAVRGREVLTGDCDPGAMSRPWVLETRPLPGSTCGWNIPPWWSVESKSFDDSTITAPRFHARFTAWFMNDE